MHAALKEWAEFEDVDRGFKRPSNRMTAPHAAFPAGQ
jgi:hypothetical protein